MQTLKLSGYNFLFFLKNYEFQIFLLEKVHEVRAL